MICTRERDLWYFVVCCFFNHFKVNKFKLLRVRCKTVHWDIEEPYRILLHFFIHNAGISSSFYSLIRKRPEISHEHACVLYKKTDTLNCYCQLDRHGGTFLKQLVFSPGSQQKWPLPLPSLLLSFLLKEAKSNSVFRRCRLFLMGWPAHTAQSQYILHTCIPDICDTMLSLEKNYFSSYTSETGTFSNKQHIFWHLVWIMIKKYLQ